jgi:hypothetical protein
MEAGALYQLVMNYYGEISGRDKLKKHKLVWDYNQKHEFDNIMGNDETITTDMK